MIRPAHEATPRESLNIMDRVESVKARIIFLKWRRPSLLLCVMETLLKQQQPAGGGGGRRGDGGAGNSVVVRRPQGEA